MRNYIIIIGFIVFTAGVGFSQEKKDTSKTTRTDIFELNIEELLNLDVNLNVASTKGDNVFTSPSSVTVITKEDIERYSYTSVSEALQTVAGFSVERTYLKRNLPTGRGILQDHYANKILVLINGIPTWNAVTGEGSIDRINILDIERIEVLKGPASVLYGTNAYTGAVNIVLKKSKETIFSAHAGYGSNDSYDAGGSINFIKNEFETFISLNSSDYAGPDKNFTDEQNVTKPINDYLKSNSANINLKYKSHSFTGNVYQVNESYYGVTPRFSAGAGNSHLGEGMLLNYTFNHNISNKLNAKFGGTYDNNSRDLSRLANDSIRASISGRRLNAFFRANLTLNEYISIELGGDMEQHHSKEYRNYIVNSDSTIATNGMDNISLMEYSGLAQLQGKYKSFSILMGGRYTKSDLFGGNFSPRITGVYAINEKNTIKAIYGKSYRTPSLFENYFYSTTTVFGNKNLKPETAQSIELTYITAFDKFFVQALVYHAIYEKKIVRTKDTTIILSDGNNLNKYPSATVYSNGNSFSANGVELEIKYANPKAINGFINIGCLLGDKGDKTNNKIIRSYSTTVKDTINVEIYNFKFMPKITVTAGLQREIYKGLSMSAVYTFIGKRGAVKPDIGAQNILDLNLSFKHNLGKLKLTYVLNCKNLLDSEMLVPEYSRLGFVNAIPFGTPRHIAFTIRLDLN